MSVSIVLYVRPQLDVINSAWWQWGAWSGQTFEKWSAQVVTWGFLDWRTVAEWWSEFDSVKDVSVRLLPADGDLAGDFFAGILDPETIRRAPRDSGNKTLPALAMEHLARNPHLRPTPGAAGIEFVMERSLPSAVDYRRAPRVFSAELAESVIQRFASSNEELVGKWLGESDRDRMRSDSQWWGVGTRVADEGFDPDAIVDPSVEDLDHLISFLWASQRDFERRLTALENLVAHFSAAQSTDSNSASKSASQRGLLARIRRRFEGSKSRSQHEG